ncbi:MAG: hypothetical protein FWF67_00475, partial [Fibromonadales bacterium]|nr:hypothetical protein [Fibromonadales bacterium]
MKKYLLIPLLTALLIACGQKEQATSEQNLLAAELVGQTIALADFVTAKPAPILSSRSTIELEFKQNVVLPIAVGQDLYVNPIDFEPPVKGKAKWLTTSLLQFVPDEPLQSGKAYKAKFDGKKAFGKAADVDVYAFEFQVIPNEILDINGGFEPVTGKVNTAKLILELRFADKPDSAKLIKELMLNFNSKRMQYKISFDGRGNFVKIESEEVSRINKAQNAEIALPKNWTTNEESFSETFLLPAIGSFVATSSRESLTEGGEKSWEVVFSDQIANDRDLSGFVSVEPNVNYKVSIKNRTLRVKGNFSYGVGYTLRIQGGFPSAYGTKTGNDFVSQFMFNDLKPQLKLIGNGLFLPMENKGRLQMKSMNLGSAKLEIREVLPQNLMFFLQNNDLRSSNRWISDIH